jgi:hypothetical protein
MPTTTALREFQYWWLHYLRDWRGSVVISVANPLLFLVAIGAGLGHLVDTHPGGGEPGEDRRRQLPHGGDVGFRHHLLPAPVHPAPLQTVVVRLPLYQSTELLRGLALGQLGPAILIAVGYLLAMAACSVWLAERRLGRMMLT